MKDAALQHRLLVMAGAVFIVITCLLAYAPAMKAGYIWDDDIYVTQNPLLHIPGGLRYIWLANVTPSPYYPMVYTVFRLEYGLWGLKPFGYHLTNIVMHAINALLLWRLLWNLLCTWLLNRLSFLNWLRLLFLFSKHIDSPLFSTRQ